MRKLTQDEIEQVIYDLQGTCRSIEEFLPEDLDADLNNVENEMELMENIDNSIFLCSSCSWWFDWGESGSDATNGEFRCAPCAEEEDQ